MGKNRLFERKKPKRIRTFFQKVLFSSLIERSLKEKMVKYIDKGVTFVTYTIRMVGLIISYDSRGTSAILLGRLMKLGRHHIILGPHV